MLNTFFFSILRKFKNLFSIISSIYFQIKLQFSFYIFNKGRKYLYNETKILRENGYIHLKKVIDKNLIEDLLKRYENEIFEEKIKKTSYYKFDIHLDADQTQKFVSYLNKKNIFNICKDYLGKIGILNCKINYQNENNCETDSMQPHHDTRGNDLKIYAWLSNYDIKSHPLYYLKKSHRNTKFFITYNHHRRKDISKEEMDKIYGDKGDVVIFDTHGWHSNVKIDTTERAVLELTVIPRNRMFKSFSDDENLLIKSI